MLLKVNKLKQILVKSNILKMESQVNPELLYEHPHFLDEISLFVNKC